MQNKFGKTTATRSTLDLVFLGNCVDKVKHFPPRGHHGVLPLVSGLIRALVLDPLLRRGKDGDVILRVDANVLLKMIFGGGQLARFSFYSNSNVCWWSFVFRQSGTKISETLCFFKRIYSPLFSPSPPDHNVEFQWAGDCTSDLNIVLGGEGGSNKKVFHHFCPRLSENWIFYKTVT